jgi:hypothetical protein
MVKKKETPAEVPVEEVKQEEVPEQEAPEAVPGPDPLESNLPPVEPEAQAPVEPEAPAETVAEAAAEAGDTPVADALKELKAQEAKAQEEQALADKPPEKQAKVRTPRVNYKALYEGQVAVNAQVSELLTSWEGQDITVRGFITLSQAIKGLLGG